MKYIRFSTGNKGVYIIYKEVRYFALFYPFKKILPADLPKKFLLLH